MKSLTSKDLGSIMHDDIYFALPSSVIKWLNTFSLNASQRLIMERMVGFALQRPSRSENSLRVRLSTSLISEFTSIKERTVISSIHKLVSEGLISKSDCNQKGTLYCVNLSDEIKSLVKLRFKKNLNSKFTVKALKSSESKEIKSELGSEHLVQLKERLNSIEEQISSLKPTLPKNFSPAMMLKQNFNFDESTTDQIAKLRNMKSKLVSQIGIAANREVLHKEKINDGILEPKALPRKDSTSAYRFIRPADSKALMTRIKNLNLFKSDGERQKFFKEILWAIRFGWYRDFKGSTYHCINHALKLIKDNTWRTPAGYKPDQIDGLIVYHKVAN